MLSTFNATFSIVILATGRAEKQLGKILLVEVGKVQRRATGNNSFHIRMLKWARTIRDRKAAAEREYNRGL